MKKTERISPPDCLNNDVEESNNRKTGFYENLKDSYGDIYPRWNTTCKDKDGKSRIRKRLSEMSDGCCGYCGDKVTKLGDMEVDHYLPSSKFPYLAYCWDNLIPSCRYCNLIKSDFTPASLKGKKIGEHIVSDKYKFDYIYDKRYLLTEITQDDRLIDPTFDDPEEHLEFNPEFYFYEAKTETGQITAKKFFNNHKELAEKWEQISLFIKKLVSDDVSEEIIHDYIKLHGCEYICVKFYAYWANEKQEGRINRK